MGATESSLPKVADVTIPVQYSLISNEYDCDDIYSFQEPIQTRKIYKPTFHATWTLDLPNSRKIPLARSSHFTVVDDDNQKVYVGYGTSFNGQLIPDFWEFDLQTMSWKEIKITNPNPMNGCRGFFYKEKIYIFGGFVNGIYSNELQVIDIQKCDVSILNTSGEIPQPRSTPILTVHNDKLYIWGGYNGEWPNDISILDLKTLVWSTVHQNESGRTSMPYVYYKDTGKVISYGGSHIKGLFIIDLNSSKGPTTKIIPTYGSIPPSDLMHSAMVKVGNLIFFFGGRNKDNDLSILYALDTIKNYWFVFHVMPDNESTTLNDGVISENGVFVLPPMHSFSAAYSKKHRTIVSFLGSPCIDPPHLSLIKIGEPLGFINLRNDMLEMLKLQSV